MTNNTYQDSLNFGEDGGLNLYDPKNPDIKMFDLIDEEQMKLSGSKLWVYLYNKSQNFDKVYMEDQNKPISPNGIATWGYYEPRVIEQNLSQFGIEISNDQIFSFNRNYITKKLGRPIRSGDIIKPDFEKNRYEIFQVQEESFLIYGTFHLICTAKILRDSEDVVERTAPVDSITHDTYLEYGK